MYRSRCGRCGAGFRCTLVAIFGLLTSGTIFAQNSDQSELDALKERMDQMQKQYEQRIEKMDQGRAQDRQQISELQAEIRALQSKAASSGSILNTRVLTDANGEAPGKAPASILDESFLRSLTRNFSFTVYLRAGFQFNGSGGGGNFNFEVPDGTSGRFRLGNENDLYMELSWNQFHILGESPDVVDASFRVTPVFANDVTRITYDTLDNQTKDFNVGMREGFVEMKNVFKSAPDITFWGGQRFYDRYNIDPNDWFWLDTSGFGVGAYNIFLGPGNLFVAWLGSQQDNLGVFNNPNQFNTVGNLFKQTIDLRYKDIDVCFGKLALILIGNYVKGAEVTPNGGSVVTPTNGFSGVFNPSDPTAFNGTATITARTSDAYGIGGGAIWQYDFGNKSYLRLAALFGWGATNFASDVQSGTPFSAATTDVNNFLIKGPSAATNVHETAPGVFNVSDNPIERQKTYRVVEEFVWNATDRFSMDFWSYWQGTDNGFRTWGFNTQKNQIITAPQTSNLVGVGFRPVFWICDNFAIQGQAGYNYVSNVRGYSDTAALGRSGSFGIFTIAPTIKPTGGYFTRPEIRLFATYARWSNSLIGTTTPIGEGGNTATNGSVPPYNHSNQGWLFGSQVEVWF